MLKQRLKGFTAIASTVIAAGVVQTPQRITRHQHLSVL